MPEITIIEDSPLVVTIRLLAKRVKHQVNFIALLRAVYDSGAKNKIPFCLVNGASTVDILLQSNSDLADLVYKLFDGYSSISKDDFYKEVARETITLASHDELVKLSAIARKATSKRFQTTITPHLYPEFDKITKGILIDFSRSLDKSASNMRPYVK